MTSVFLKRRACFVCFCTQHFCVLFTAQSNPTCHPGALPGICTEPSQCPPHPQPFRYGIFHVLIQSDAMAMHIWCVAIVFAQLHGPACFSVVSWSCWAVSLQLVPTELVSSASFGGWRKAVCGKKSCCCFVEEKHTFQDNYPQDRPENHKASFNDVSQQCKLKLPPFMGGGGGGGATGKMIRFFIVNHTKHQNSV